MKTAKEKPKNEVKDSVNSYGVDGNTHRCVIM